MMINIDEYLRYGAAIFSDPLMDDNIVFLQDQLKLIYLTDNKVRPWFFWDLHNPWGRSATAVDSWRFLDLCQSPKLLQQISTLIGKDIILYDSQFSPDLGDMRKTDESWVRDSYRCPTDPLAGLVVRVPFAKTLSNENSRFIFMPGSHKDETSRTSEQSIVLKPGQIICHDINLHYRITNMSRLTAPVEYLIRYFPATSLYLRDPALPIHHDLTERYPLLNYAQIPLWLVHGEDRSNNDFVAGFQAKAGRWVNTE